MTESWKFAFASAIGNSHIAGNIPCQDACGVDNCGDYTISVVCDGAGSCEHSHKGAEMVAKECLYRFGQLVKLNKWHKPDNFPNEAHWRKEAKHTLYSVKETLVNLSIEEDLPIKSLSCTVILAITLNQGLLLAHIGDGRAGYCNQNNEWFPMMVPFHGHEANETVFITSEIWYDEVIDSYLGCNIIKNDVKAFCLLSDGCEKAAFECNLYDEEKETYYDPNRPYVPFFQSNIDAIPKLFDSGKSQLEINDAWRRFLTDGNEKLKIESDDKTIILGVKVRKSQ